MFDPQDGSPTGDLQGMAPVRVQAATELDEVIFLDSRRLSDLWYRRLAFTLSAIVLTAGLCIWLLAILQSVDFGFLDVLLFVFFLIAIPSLVIPACSSVIGFALMHGARDPLDAVCHAARSAGSSHEAITGRVAVAMVLRNEDAARAFAHFKPIVCELERMGHGSSFDYHVLSDSTDADAIESERREFEAWRVEHGHADQLFYRRRLDGKGFKGGNVYEFCEQQGARYQILVLLDADSLMSGRLIIRLVQIMLANPRLGLLQSLSVGLPSLSFFARVFQFGHRHGMRCFAMGAAWWQGDSCQYWGHNCAVRVRPYVEHCRPLMLPGRPPFGGPIICHDQIEAALMHRAGYEVRFLPVEGGSYEGNPPALLEFLARHVRWCQGNMQNLGLLNMPGLTALNFFHLAYVGIKFIGAAALVALVTVAVIAAAQVGAGHAAGGRPFAAFYLICLLLYFAPRLLGILDAMIRNRSAYGGATRLLAGGLVDILLTFFLAPVSMVAATWCLLNFPFGGSLTWDRYQRDSHHVSWDEACARLWPVTMFGFLLLVILATTAPSAIPWFMPFLAGLLLSIPFAVVTSSSGLGSWAERWKICATPEEIEMPPEVAAILPVVLRNR